MEPGFAPGSEAPPVNALKLGQQIDGSGDYYLAVANTEWGTIPGKAQPGTCWYSYYGVEYSTTDFRWVTYVNTMATVPNTGSGPPAGCRPVGMQTDGRGEQYAVIANTDKGKIAGKACADTNCWYTYDGVEYETSDFAWLTCNRISANSSDQPMDVALIHCKEGCPETALNFGEQNDGRGSHSIAVAETEWGTIPGKAEDGTCWYGYNGKEHTTKDFHYVAQSSPHSLVPNNKTGPPPGAIIAGMQNDGRGEQYAVIAVSEQHGRVPGKAGANTNCWYPYGGKEHETDKFEWIVLQHQQCQEPEVIQCTM